MDNDIKLLTETTNTKSEAEKLKRDYYIELVLFLVLGILAGVAVKTEASRRITIGYNDYKMKIGANNYSINKLQTEWIKKQNAEMENQENQSEGQDASMGATCSNNQQ